ncbi:MAG: hypothetical protein ACOC28_04360 [Alkalispirochaetaceae bacterium]
MKEIVPRGESRSEVVETGIKAIFSVTGGFSLLLLRGLTTFGSFSIPGIVAGGALALFGLGTAAGRERADRIGGALTFLAGGATVAASLPVVGAPANAVMWIAGLSFVGFGIVTFTRFLAGVRSRK